jgi:hypothetical protein
MVKSRNFRASISGQEREMFLISSNDNWEVDLGANSRQDSFVSEDQNAYMIANDCYKIVI